MIASISSMSAVIAVVAIGSAPLISSARRRRDSGVLRSCEMPASTIARSRSMLCRSLAMRLKAAATVRISRGPSSGSGSGCWPRPRRCAARRMAASGRAMLDAMRYAPTSASTSTAAIQPSHCSPNCGVKRSRGSITQNSSSSMKKLTQKPSSPSCENAKRVSAPRLCRTFSATFSKSGSSGKGWVFSLAVTGKTRSPSVSFISMRSWRRSTGSALTRAARVRFTVLTVCCASSRERGSRS